LNFVEIDLVEKNVFNRFSTNLNYYNKFTKHYILRR